MEELYNEFKCYAGGYFGVRSMDEYDLKVYVLKDIEKYIKEFITTNNLGLIYSEEMERVDDSLNLKTKLQDALIVLPKVDAPMELIHLVKLKLKEINEEEMREFKNSL